MDTWKTGPEDRYDAIVRPDITPNKRGSGKAWNPLGDALYGLDTPIRDLVMELKGKYFLTKYQTAFLMWRPYFSSDRDTLRFCQISYNTYKNWFKDRTWDFSKNHWRNNPYKPGEEPNIKGAIDEYRERLPEIASLMMMELAPKAAIRTREMMDATYTKHDKQGNVVSEEADWSARAKAIEIASRWLHKGYNESSDNSPDQVYAKKMEGYMELLKEVKALPSPDQGITVDAEYVEVKSAAD